jgi:glycosyltransferase involved in cell wall biosynthesis
VKRKRLVSIAHSYVVALNRRLAHEMARVGDEWEVTAVSPAFLHGDLRPISVEPYEGEACDLETVPLHFTRRAHSMLYGRRLKEILQRRWDIVHCWEEPYVLSAGQIARWTPPDTPFVFWTAQNLPKRYPPPFSFVERYCVDRCAAWMACGQSVVDALGPRGYAAKPHRVIPLGVDVEHFQHNASARRRIRERLDWNDEIPVIGYLGRFVAEKGLPLLMRALDAVETPWRAMFVGGGPMERQLRDWAAHHGDRVRVVTGVPHDAVPAHLSAMDVLCAPSQTGRRWREQQGRMIIEAFATGVPVISSDSGEIPHVVADAGIVLPESSLDKWTHAIATLLSSPERRRELSERGLERAHRVYSWPVIARAHIALFDEILDTRAAASVTVD